LKATSTFSAAAGGCSVGPLLNAEQVAEMLGVPTGWVYRASRDRLIPTVRLGRYYRYRASAIRSWLADRECAP
jgi:excisionase family DNA binding protein